MKILAIETSCDETAISLVECSGGLSMPSFKVLGNALNSQVHIHKDYGGVFPMLAKREHEKNLPTLLEQALQEAHVDTECPHIDYIAVTSGPGLEPALWTGITFAEALGKKWDKPVLPVNHMEGHLWSVLYQEPPISNSQFPISKKIEFPAIALLVSGGHTELVLVEGFDKFRVIGETRDDAVGEAFDKTARILGFPYPGGPAISAMADIARAKGLESSIKLPRPMINTDDYDFSYSGLKTAVLYAVRKLGEPDEDTKQEIAMEFENAAIEPLIAKTGRAAEAFDARSLIVGGGVSANKHLRKNLTKLAGELSLDLRLPRPELTTDNAVMIAIAAYVRAETGRDRIPASGIRAEGRLEL